MDFGMSPGLSLVCFVIVLKLFTVYVNDWYGFHHV